MMPALQPEIGTEFLSLFPGRHLIALGNGHKFIDLAYNKYAKATMVAENRNNHIYFVVNEVSGSKRLDSDVVRYRAIFIDDDGVKKGGLTDKEKFPIPPNITVETSPGQYHYYWLTDTTNEMEWRGVQRNLIQSFGGDPACSNPARIMRVPGYVNIKPHHNGWVVKHTIHSSQPYPWTELVAAFPPVEESIDTVIEGEFPARKEYIGDAEALRLIASGEAIHEGRIAFSMHHASIGDMPYDTCLAAVTMALNMGHEAGRINTPSEPRRYEERIGNMAAVVKTAYAKREKELNVIAIRSPKSKDSKFTKLEMPPGGLGILTRDVMKYMHYPSLEMAVPVAMHCTGVFCGGLYRFMHSVGNRKRTILAASTMGKSIAGNYFREMIRSMAHQEKMHNINVHRYSADGAYNTAMLHSEFFEHRVRGDIIAEAGLEGQSKVGMSVDQRRQWMDILTMNYKSVLTQKKYSGASAGKAQNDKLGDCYGIVGLQLAESVPQNFVEMLHKNNAFMSGDVGRQELIFVEPVKPMRNYDALGDIDPAIIKGYYSQVLRFEAMGCLDGNRPDNHAKFIPIDTSQVIDAYRELDHEKGHIEFNKYSEDDVMQALVGRYMERLQATILVLVQADMALGLIKKPVATMADHFLPAVQYQNDLDRSLKAQLYGGALATPLERCVQRVEARMDSWGLSNDKQFAKDFRKGYVGQAWLTKVMGNYSGWKELQSANYGRLSQAQQELRAALISNQLLIEIPYEGKTPYWKLNL